MRLIRTLLRRPSPPRPSPSPSPSRTDTSRHDTAKGESWSFNLKSLNALSEVYVNQSTLSEVYVNQSTPPSSSSSTPSSSVLPLPTILLIILPDLKSMHHSDKSLVNAHVIQRFGPRAQPSSPSRPPPPPSEALASTSTNHAASSSHTSAHLSPLHPLITSGILPLPLPSPSPSLPCIMHHDCSSLSDVYHFISDLGHAVGASTQTTSLIDRMKSSFASISTAALKWKEQGSVKTRLLLVDRVFQVKAGEWRLLILGSTFRPAWLNEILTTMLGMEDAALTNEDPSSVTITWGEAVKCSPDLIVFLTPSSTAPTVPPPSLLPPLSGPATSPQPPMTTLALPQDLSKFLHYASESGQWWNQPSVRDYGKVATVDRSLLFEAGPDLVKGAQTLMSLAAYPHPPPLLSGLKDGLFAAGGRKGQVTKLSLEGGERCRSSQIANHFTPFPSTQR